MTVKELIEELKKVHDENIPVLNEDNVEIITTQLITDYIGRETFRIINRK